ncbi:MAG: sulfite exporter TauE/SafE family protein [Magnetococcales bacterium]|nr:sulfite exporter TauE/SafE family protein [Magnetococcales bacterium]
MEPLALTFPTTLLVGLTMGVTACAAYCLPYFGAWVLGQEGGRTGWDAAGFVAGRMLVYGVLGALAGGAGRIVTATDAGWSGDLVLAVVSCGCGGWLVLRAGGGSDPSHHGCGVASVRSWPPFLLGMAVSWVPCPALTALLAACSWTESALVGGLHGAVFGLGASLGPVVLASAVLGRTGQVLRGLMPGWGLWMQRVAGLALIGLAWRHVV